MKKEKNNRDLLFFAIRKEVELKLYLSKIHLRYLTILLN